MADNDSARLDDAARAGWLYYIAGRTQDDIAGILNISRPAAQRLVSLSRSEGLISFQMNHPMGACIERVSPMSCPLHRLVSLVGTISPDGSASPFDTLVKLAEITKAQHFPMPLPLYVSSAEERAQLIEIESIRRIRAIAGEADLWLMGISQIGEDA